MMYCVILEELYMLSKYTCPVSVFGLCITHTHYEMWLQPHENEIKGADFLHRTQSWDGAGRARSSAKLPLQMKFSPLCVLLKNVPDVSDDELALWAIGSPGLLPDLQPGSY